MYSTNKLNKENKLNNSDENGNEGFNTRCENNNYNAINSTRIFIDKKIKFLESIVVNFQIIVKRDIFMDKKRNIKNKKRFLDINYNISNENETNELIKLYTKNERIIKSENINNEIIEWKFNNPSITIKIDDFIEDKRSRLIIIRQNPFKFFSYMVFSSFMIIFCIYTFLRFLGLNSIIGILSRNSVYGNNDGGNYNNPRRLDIGYGDNVNNYENENQFQRRNYRNLRYQNHQYQIDRDDSESNPDSP